MGPQAKVRALIVGAGRIGATYDTPQSPFVLTHAHAYQAHPGVELLGFVDPNLEAAEQAAARWGGSAWKQLKPALELNPDCVSLCTPAGIPRLEALQTIAATKNKPKALILEKPVARSLGELSEVEALLTQIEPKLWFHYPRQWAPGLDEVRKEIVNGNFGQMLSGFARYRKGFLNNGSHLLQLIESLGTPIVAARVRDAISDFSAEDPTLSLDLELAGNIPLVVQTGIEKLYSICELNLLFEKACIRFDSLASQVSILPVVDDPDLAGYRILSYESRPMPLGTDKALAHLVSDMVKVLGKGGSPALDARAMIRYETKLLQIAESYKQGLKEVRL